MKFLNTTNDHCVSFSQNTLMSELKTRVEELKMENEYQLRLKEMNHSDKIKEMTDKSVQEIDALKTKHTVSHWLLHFGEYVHMYVQMCKHVCLYVFALC